MSLFHDILNKLQKNFIDEQGKNKDIAAIITSVLGVVVADTQVTIKKGTVYVQVPPTAKMALSLKKEAILKQCREKGISVFNLQ